MFFQKKNHFKNKKIIFHNKNRIITKTNFQKQNESFQLTFKSFTKSNNIPLRGKNIKLLYNRQCKSTIFLKQDKFILLDNATNTSVILTNI